MSNKTPGLVYLRDSKNTELVLKIKRENITSERNFKITDQEMYSNNSTHHNTNFYHNGDDGLTFQCTALFVNDKSYSAKGGNFSGSNYKVDNNDYGGYTDNILVNSEQGRYNNDEKTFKVLDSWYRGLHPFKIVFGKNINLKLPLVSKNWIVTKLTMNQEMDNVTEWSITFRTYNPPKKIKKVNNDLVNRTSKSYKWQHKCKKTYKKLTYKKMKKKRGNECAKLLNSILIELGYMKKSKRKVKTKKKNKNGKPVYKTEKYVPDKCTKKTVTAVKNFKKDWNKYKLKPKLNKTKKGKYTDIIDKNTYKALSNYKKLKSAKKKK